MPADLPGRNPAGGSFPPTTGPAGPGAAAGPDGAGRPRPRPGNGPPAPAPPRRRPGPGRPDQPFRRSLARGSLPVPVPWGCHAWNPRRLAGVRGRPTGVPGRQCGPRGQPGRAQNRQMQGQRPGARAGRRRRRSRHQPAPPSSRRRPPGARSSAAWPPPGPPRRPWRPAVLPTNPGSVGPGLPGRQKSPLTGPLSNRRLLSAWPWSSDSPPTRWC